MDVFTKLKNCPLRRLSPWTWPTFARCCVSQRAINRSMATCAIP